MVNNTLILDFGSQGAVSFPSQVLEGHLTIVSMKISVHKDSLCWPTLDHTQIIVGSLSLSIQGNVAVVRKYKWRKKRLAITCN